MWFKLNIIMNKFVIKYLENLARMYPLWALRSINSNLINRDLNR